MSREGGTRIFKAHDYDAGDRRAHVIPVDQPDRTEAPSPADVIATLVDDDGRVDEFTAAWTLHCIVGLLSRETGKTPRAVLRDELAAMPDDEYWQAATRAALCG